MNVVVFDKSMKMPAADVITEAILREACADGVLHAATVAMKWYCFQGGDTKAPAAFWRWLSLRKLDLELRVVLVAAREIAAGNPLDDHDMARLRLATSRVGIGRDTLRQVMCECAKGVAHR